MVGGPLRIAAHGGIVSDVGWLKTKGLDEVGLVVYNGNNPSPAFIKNAGIKYATLNPWNDSGDPPYSNGDHYAGYMQSIKSNGWDMVAGEGRGGDNVRVCNNYLWYCNYGGIVSEQQYDMYASPWLHPKNGSHVDYIETYNNGGGLVLDSAYNCIAAAKNAGSQELGILIGDWMCSSRGIGSGTYIAFIDRCRNAGLAVNTALFWCGYNYDITSSLKGKCNEVMQGLINHYGIRHGIGSSGGGGGGTTPVTPAPTPAPGTAGNCPCKHIWCGIVGAPSLYTFTQTSAVPIELGGIQGWVDNAGGWVPNKPDATRISIVQKSPNGSLQTIGTVTPDAKGNFRASIKAPGTGTYHYNAKGASGNWGNDCTVVWQQFGANPAPGSPAIDFAGSTPAACSPNGSDISVFVRGTDAAIWFRSWYSGSWHDWTSIGGITGAMTGPGAASWGSGRMDVFTGGSNSHVWHKFNTSGQWSGWEDLSGLITSDCAATSSASGQLSVFVRGTNGVVYHKRYVGGAWGSWVSITGLVKEGTAPAACSWGGERIDVVVTGTDSHVWHNSTANGTTWSGWVSIGGTTAASPAIATLGSGQLAVFVRGTDDELWMKQYSGGAWGDWLEMGGTLAYGPGIGACATATEYHVFVIGTTGSVYHTYGSAAWTGWQNVGGKVAIPATEPEMASGGLIPANDSESMVPPITVPDKDEDLTLPPTDPVPTTQPEGLTVILRDHKKNLTEVNK